MTAEIATAESARFATLGAAVATTTGVRHDYGPHPDQYVEVYGNPASASATVIVVHGGYFRPRTSLSHARPMAAALAEAGLLCVLVEYRRFGGRPHCLDDVTAAIDATMAWFEEWGLNAGAAAQVTVAGHSAGGALVLAWASHLDTSGPPLRLRPLAPITDLFREVDEGLAGGAVLDYMGVGPNEDLAAYVAHDPRSRALLIPDRIDVVLIHGDADATVDIGFSRTFPAEVHVLAGAHHADLVDPESHYFPDVVKDLLDR